MKKIYSIILGLLFILNINQIHSQEATNDTIVPIMPAIINNDRLSFIALMFVFLNISSPRLKLLHKFLKMSFEFKSYFNTF